MTDQPCVRGCPAQCHADECRKAGEHNHPPLLRPAAVGFLCERCAGNLRGWLADIPDLYAEMWTMSITEHLQSGEPTGSMHTKVSASPALVDLHLMSIQDEAGKIGAGITPVVTAMVSWARRFHEEQGFHGSHPRELWPAINLLTVWWGTVLFQPWVDELYLEVRDIHRMLCNATNRPKPIGRCWGMIRNRPNSCGELLYPSTDGSGAIVCEKCHRKYEGLETVRLQLQTERDERRGT